MDGCRSSGEGAAGGSASLRCLFLFLEVISSPGALPHLHHLDNSVRVPFLAAGSGLSLWRSLEREAGRAGLGPSPFPASSCCCSPACDTSSSPPSPLGAEGIGWKLLSEVIPTPGSAEVFQERPGLAGFSPPFPSGTHRGISRALSEHCLQHLLPRQGPDLC